jgi:hypothetical protein
VVLGEDISGEAEREAVETAEEEEEEAGEVVIDQLRFFANISKLWHNVIHGNLPIEVLLSTRESTVHPKARVTRKETKKKEKRKKAREEKKAKTKKKKH